MLTFDANSVCNSAIEAVSVAGYSLRIYFCNTVMLTLVVVSQSRHCTYHCWLCSHVYPPM